jgi:hypothetical protein
VNWHDAAIEAATAFEPRRERVVVDVSRRRLSPARSRRSLRLDTSTTTMSLQASPPVDASADVSLRVPRGEDGTLECGVADVLANVDGVSDVTVERVTSVRPTWTDVRVDADVTLTVETATEADDRSAAVEATLADGFGVTDVNGLVVDGDE